MFARPLLYRHFTTGEKGGDKTEKGRRRHRFRGEFTCE